MTFQITSNSPHRHKLTAIVCHGKSLALRSTWSCAGDRCIPDDHETISRRHLDVHHDRVATTRPLHCSGSASKSPGERQSRGYSVYRRGARGPADHRDLRNFQQRHQRGRLLQDGLHGDLEHHADSLEPGGSGHGDVAASHGCRLQTRRRRHRRPAAVGDSSARAESFEQRCPGLRFLGDGAYLVRTLSLHSLSDEGKDTIGLTINKISDISPLRLSVQY